jgi:RNA polymerase sigma-54 factor
VAQLAAFAAHDWAAAGAALGLDAEAARARAALMRGLSQRPVPETHARNAEVLRPDLVLDRRRDGVMRVSLAGGARRRLTLDEALVRRARAEGFEPGLLERAQALVAALEQRGQTLHRIGDWLLQNQTGFFHTGLGAIAPASRVAVAQDLGLHPSTVSRAVQGKAIDVDGRLWPLAVFFSAALSGVDGPVSAQAVRKRIGDLVAAETPGRPLSDETITGLLRAEGVDIARRTVAKYRQGLRIPSSSERRKIAAFRRGE